MSNDNSEYESIDDVEFPVDFRMPCHDQRKSDLMLYENGLLDDDESLMDFLKYYPGEVIIHGEIERDGLGYTFNATELKFNGTTFTPETDE